MDRARDRLEILKPKRPIGYRRCIRLTPRRDLEVAKRVRHPPFPASLVGGAGAAFHHGDIESGAADQKIVHAGLANATEGE